MDFKKVIEAKEYDFLREDEHLKDRIMLLSLGGSHAYGTQREDGQSDIDVRGVALERPSDLIGLTEFEQIVETNTDTTIYAFNKMIKLLMNCNPNVIEILGCKPEHYLIVSKEGQQLLDNRDIFLSQKAIGSFSGYASQQLSRLENALARDRLGQVKKEEHILNSIRNAMMTFESRYTEFDENKVILDLGDSDKEDMDKEIKVTIDLKEYSLRELAGMLGEMQNVIRLYDKVNHRNKKKDDNHLDKHAQHLIRLYIMGLDILERGKIVTYRENELDILRKIRTGGYRKDDESYDESFFELVEEYKKRFKYAAKNTFLPKEPDSKKIEELIMDINGKIIKGLM